MATDLSEKQLLQAIANKNIIYSVGKAEQTDFADDSFDLITIAQAYHWFHFSDFEKEARRVAKPGAVIAAWGYNLPLCRHEAVNNQIKGFYTNVVGSYWDRERKYVEENYETIPFNFEPLPAKTFSIPVSWTKDDVSGYLNSWSSVQHFIKAMHYNPVNDMATQLQSVWPEEKNMIEFIFPVFLRIGRIIK